MSGACNGPELKHRKYELLQYYGPVTTYSGNSKHQLKPPKALCCYNITPFKNVPHGVRRPGFKLIKPFTGFGSVHY